MELHARLVSPVLCLSLVFVVMVPKKTAARRVYTRIRTVAGLVLCCPIHAWQSRGFHGGTRAGVMSCRHFAQDGVFEAQLACDMLLSSTSAEKARMAGKVRSSEHCSGVEWRYIQRLSKSCDAQQNPPAFHPPLDFDFEDSPSGTTSRRAASKSICSPSPCCLVQSRAVG